MPEKAGRGLSKRQRLLKPAQFSRVFKTGKRLVTKNFQVYFLRQAENNKADNAVDESRLGVSVSSVSGNAAGRNRIKRLVREFFRLNRDAMLGGMAVDVVFAFKKSSRTTEIKDYAAIYKELGVLFAKTC